jgi:glycosyltransferase involved in cell wall biosynthesis
MDGPDFPCANTTRASTLDVPLVPCINGRFVTQSLSGVQRFAVETTRALQARDDYRLITQAGGHRLWTGAQDTGRLAGQAWEQVELPRAVAGALLINLGNTGPLSYRRQILVIHDTGVFSTPEAYSTRFRLWYKLMQTWLVRRAVPIVTVSAFSRSEIIKHLRARPDQVSVMPEGADHMLRMTAAPDILLRHGLLAEQYVLAVGTLSAHKNLIALSPLAQALQARGMPLVIVGGFGSGAFKGANADRLPQPARYIGRVTDEELKALYEHAGCFVFPSRYEGFGLPAVEAMACGCPVIAADIPALREVCGDAAVFCDPEAPGSITHSVMTMLDDSALRARFRERGRAQTAGLTWAKAAARLHAIIQEQREPA